MAKLRGALECVACRSVESSRRALLTHYANAHSHTPAPPPLRCTKCSFSTRTRSHLMWHSAVSHEERRGGRQRRLRCDGCYYSTIHEACLRSHLRLEGCANEGGGSRLGCASCGLPFASTTQLVHHLATHKSHPAPPATPPPTTALTPTPKQQPTPNDDPDSRLLRCSECSFKTRWRSSIVHHVNNAHKRHHHQRQIKREKPDTFESVYIKQEPLDEDETPTGDVKVKLEDGGDFLFSRIRVDKELNKFFCTECKYSSKRKTSITAHVNIQHRHAVEKFKCTQCPYTTKMRGRLVKHTEKHIKSENGAPAPTRERRGKRSSHKYSSQFVKDTEGLYKCTECEYSTKWRSSIIAHVDNYHNPDAEEYKCQQCSYKTRVKAYLQQHRVTHRIANTTGKKMKRTPRKYKQIVRDAETNVYRCSECEYSTKWRSSIIAHVDNYHNPDAEVYSCTKCSYTCKVKSYLQQHLLTHERGNSTAGRRVTGSSKYKQLSYDPARDLFTCTDCEYTSKWRGSVIAHIGLRHNSDATVYRCPHCPYSSKVKSYFVQHSRTHEAKLFKCHLCPFETKNKRTLEHHNQKEHTVNAAPPNAGVVTAAPYATWDGVQYCAAQYDGSQIIATTNEAGQIIATTTAAAATTGEWPPNTTAVVVENEVPDINSLEPSIESSPDLTLAIEMNLNDNTLTCNSPDMTEFFPQQSYACPYCAYIAYNKEEVFRHVAYHHQQIEAVQMDDGSGGGGGSSDQYGGGGSGDQQTLHTLQTAHNATALVHNNVITTMHYYYTTQHGQPVPLQLNL